MTMRLHALTIGRRFDICRLALAGEYESCRALISNTPGTPWREYLDTQHIRALDALPALSVARGDSGAILATPARARKKAA